MTFNKDKFKQIVLYIINNISGSELGKTKLHKILVLSDLEKYLQTNNTITGETYIRNYYGPTSIHLQEVLDELHKEKAVKIDRVDDDSMWLYYPMKNADLSFLNENDKNIIDKLINQLRQYTAVDLSMITHTPYWQELQNGDVMQIELYAEEYLINNDISVELDKIDA